MMVFKNYIVNSIAYYTSLDNYSSPNLHCSGRYLRILVQHK